MHDRGAPLGERLVQEALELLAREGLEGLSLRKLARRTGVSHNAPLRHFRSFKDLCSEVAARGFALLSEAMRKAHDVLPPGAGPRARLAASGRAYVHAAVENPALFALMFRMDDLDSENMHFQRESAAAFERLVGQIRAAQDNGWRSEHDSRLLAGAAWASFHGLASLWSQQAFVGPVPGATLDDALATTLDLVLSDPEGEPH